jgi:hypothetical protein
MARFPYRISFPAPNIQVPKVSQLWSRPICRPITKACAAACFIDIATLIWRLYHPASSQRLPFSLLNVLFNFVGHFLDAKLFDYFPRKAINDPNLQGSFGLYIVCRCTWCVGCYSENLGSLLQEAWFGPFGEGFGSIMSWVESKILALLWITVFSGGLGVWLLVAVFVCLYNLITIQMGWLLRILLNENGAEGNETAFRGIV